MAKKFTVTPEMRAKFEERKRARAFVWEGGPYQAWAIGFINLNFWRVSHLWLSQEDALQECALAFIRCSRVYKGSLDNPRHIMGFYQRAVHNAFHSASVKTTRSVIALRCVEAELMAENKISSAILRSHPESNVAASIEKLLRDAGDELRGVVELLLAAPGELIMMDPSRLNARISRLLGLKPDKNGLFWIDHLAKMRKIINHME